MKPMLILLKREWLEWRRVIIGTVAVITFLNLLMLLSVSRGSAWFHETLERDGHVTLEEVRINDDEEVNVDIRMQGDDIEVYIDGEGSSKSLDAVMNRATIPVAFGMRVGMQLTFAFVLFLSLFYFSDAIYKERADNSTLFYRSLPVNDHLLLGSKIMAGLVGMVGLTLLFSIEYLIFVRLAIVIMGEPLNSLASAVLSRISYFNLFWDYFSYLIFAAIRMTPLALFLMLVGSYVKGRPLLVGIGGPILLSISWAIIFQSAALLKSIGKFFWGFNQILIDQWDITENGFDGDVIMYGSFWGYIFNVETLMSLVVSGLLYYGLWQIYRKNIPTG
ncbi:hypothetical protein HQ531_09415 [bacterium]|nr:hypothetical protein [bacterium]